MTVGSGAHLRTLALWCAGAALVAFYGVGIAARWYIPMAVVAALVLVAVPVLGWASARAQARRDDAAFVAVYGSLDGARAVLDLEELRAVRDAEGVVPAVRALRHSHPAIPLAQAADIIRSL